MKKFFCLVSALLITLFLSAGCNTLTNMKTTVSEKVSSNSTTEEGLFSEVPRKNRKGIQPAKVALRVAEEEVAVAELKKEMAAENAKYAEDNLDLAKMIQEEATLNFEILKLEAIDRSNLGDKESNTTELGELRAKMHLKLAEKSTFEAKLKNLKMRIDAMAREIKAGEKRIRGLKR